MVYTMPEGGLIVFIVLSGYEADKERCCWLARCPKDVPLHSYSIQIQQLDANVWPSDAFPSKPNQNQGFPFQQNIHCILATI